MKKLAFLFFALSAAACNNPSGTQPIPPLTTDAGVPPLASPPRTVGHRNPFGDVLQADNLMVDGDFELTGRSDQAPWIVYNNQAQQTLNYDTGGRCRSGIRCALIGTGDQLIGFLSSPPLASFEVRIYVQPSGTSCHDATVLAFDLATNNTGVTAEPLTTSPDVDGWCLFDGVSQSLTYGEPTILVSLSTGASSKTLHVDQGSVLPATEVPIHGITPPPMKRAPDDVIARATEAANWIRSHRKFGRNVPNITP